jgi:hypothetical protein
VTPMVTSPTCISLIFSASSCSRRMLSTVNCAWRMMRRPSSVSDIPLRERCSRARPSSLSRSLIYRLTAGLSHVQDLRGLTDASGLVNGYQCPDLMEFHVLTGPCGAMKIQSLA